MIFEEIGSRPPPFTRQRGGLPGFGCLVCSQTREFGVRLVLAPQSTDQASGNALEGALEHCRLNIVSGLGRDSAVDQ